MGGPLMIKKRNLEGAEDNFQRLCFLSSLPFLFFSKRGTISEECCGQPLRCLVDSTPV